MTPPREAIRGWSGTKTHYPFDARSPVKSTVRSAVPGCRVLQCQLRDTPSFAR